jgi:Predicted dienelactone hydrolase
MTRSLVGTLGLFVALCLPLAARAADEIHAGFRKTTLEYQAGGEERKRNVQLWYPTTTVAERYSYHPQIGLAAPEAAVLDRPNPLILFSHGYLGVADQTIFLTEELARRGYIVAGLNHADSLFERREKPLPPPNFGRPETWDDAKYRDRKEDLVALLDHLLKLNDEKDSWLFHRIDPKQIGALGHSLGGYTVLGLVGGWDSWRDERIKACVALSPYSLPFVRSPKASEKGIRVPVMFQGGTLDFGITPFIGPLYEKLPAPKYFLTLKSETHFGWTNFASLGQTTTECIKKGNPELITNYTAAFFDCHLRGQPAAELLTKDNERLQSFHRLER